MIQKTIILCIAFMTIVSMLMAQTNEPSTDKLKTLNAKKTSGQQVFNLDMSANMDFPLGNMADRFGTNFRLGTGIRFKSSNNWMLGIKGELIIGNNIREDSLMINLITSQGGVISQLGEVLNVGTFERGYLLGIQAGKIFPVWMANANSGPITLFSMGFMQHKIKLFDRDNSFPQLRDEYVKGYDRLSNGLYVENFTGYMYYAKNKLINCYAGINFVWGFTRGRRDYQFDIARKDDAARNDVLLGFKVGWIIPIYKKITEETYY